jgi:hypothetical protein
VSPVRYELDYYIPEDAILHYSLPFAFKRWFLPQGARSGGKGKRRKE